MTEKQTLIRHLGSVPLLRRTVDSINPDTVVVLCVRRTLERAVLHYAAKYRILPEFRILDWDEDDPLCAANSGYAVAPAHAIHEYPHKECCVYAPQYALPWGDAGAGYEGSWQHLVTAAHELGLRSLLCERSAMECFPFFGQTRLPAAWFAEHIHAFTEVYDLLADEESKTVFAAIVRARLTGDPGYIPVAAYPQYYHPEVRAQAGDTVCDAGGGDGADLINMTSAWFSRTVGSQGTVFCFEPIAANYANLRGRAAAFPNITVERCGLWSEQTAMPIVDRGCSSWLDLEAVETGIQEREETQTCSFIDLDSYFSMKHARCDFLKMDIEGAELPALKGAVKTLRAYRPKLAISVYHHPLKDFLAIPKFIRDLDLGYEFFLGHHWPYWFETVLYCKPGAR